MLKDPALDAARSVVVAFFEARRPRAYTHANLRAVISAQVPAWKLSVGTQASQVIALLEEEGLREVELHSDEYRDFARYLWRDCTPLEIASTLRRTGYLSHGTAVFLLGLTEQLPRTFYINHEQSPKPSPSGPLSQDAINRAFRAKQRSSRYSFQLEGYRYTILSGKNTGRYGVEEMQGPSGELLRVAGIERTLVDIAVRPAYAGGLYEVLEAFKNARERGVSLSRIVATLQALDYRYPYHQSIGFLMERAGFEPKQLERLREFGIQYDFYLGYGIDKPDFDSSWRIFIPQGF